MFHESAKIQMVCDCAVKDSLVCKQNPDCRPSYCKMRLFDPPILLASEPPQHTTEENFQHFLSYSGHRMFRYQDGTPGQQDLREAFYAGADVPPPEKPKEII